MDIRIEKPILNPRKTPEENIAVIDTWIADTADKLNYLISQIERSKGNGSGDRRN